MSNRKLAVLGIVAALMVVWAVIQSHISKSQTSARGPLQDSYLIQGLDTAKIANIVIGKGDNPVRLDRHGDLFVVASKDGYPALTGKINNLITSCLDIRLAELITTNPVNHESLHVTEQTAQNVVKFLDSDEQTIAGLIIGTSRLPDLEFSKRSTYVRLISSDDVYEGIDVPISIGSSMDFIDKELLNVARNDIVEVVVTSPQESYTLKPADSNDGEVALQDMPADRKQKDYECKQVFTALQSFTFSDVEKQSSEPEGTKFDRTYVCKLKDSTDYTLEIAKDGDKAYVRCRADFTDTTPVVKEKRVESKEELQAKEAKLLARQAAANFTEKCKGWVYEIPQWKAGNLTKMKADFLEEKEQEEKGQQGELTASSPPSDSKDPNTQPKE